MIPSIRRRDDYIRLTLYDFASRYIGVKEMAGNLDNPLIMAMLKLDPRDQDPTFTGWPQHDEVAWCSAAMNWWCWNLRLPRSKHLQARSWLEVGRPISIKDAKPMNDIVILKRGSGRGSAGPEEVDRSGPIPLWPPGHVACFGGMEPGVVLCLGGNQSNTVSLAPYARDHIIGVRRLHP
jgi:uncharacterized protein (TIGR02594 family)